MNSLLRMRGRGRLRQRLEANPPGNVRRGRLSPGIRRVTAIALAAAWILSGCVSARVSVTLAPDGAIGPGVARANNGAFSVDVPKQLLEEVRVVRSRDDQPIEVHFFLSESGHGPDYGVVYGDIPGSDPLDIDAVYRDGVQGDINTTGATLVKSESITFDGRPANRHSLSGPRGDYEYVSMLVGRRLYVLSVIGASDDLTRPEVDNFFSSFHADG